MRLKIFNEEPYGELICQHVNLLFPEVAQFKDCERVEAISNILIGTKEFRYGSLPNPEHLVVLRNVIRFSIENNIAIPILIPWGSIKPNFTSKLDVAELSALKRIICVQSEVQRYYEQGLDIVIRVEDTSGYSLFGLENDKETLHKNIDEYTSDFVNLVNILAPFNQIRVIPESTMANSASFESVFYANLVKMYNYLTDSWGIIQVNPKAATELESYKILVDEGWLGTISYEQRMHYISAYQRLYSDWDMNKMINRLALYFTGAWTRSLLKMTGRQSYWEKFIQFTFVPPIKGLPSGYDYNYVYQRTLPLWEARTHMPPWRSKGYLRINGNEIQHKITSFNDSELISQLIPVDIEISDENNNTKVIIGSDYLLES